MDENENTDASAVEQPAELPNEETLAGMSEQEVTEALAAAEAEAAELRALEPADMSDAQADRLVAIADFNDAVVADSERRAADVEARAQRVAEANARLDGNAGGDGEPGDEGDDSGDGDGEEGDDAGDGDAAPESVAASARPAQRPTASRVRQLTRRTPDPAPARAEDTGRVVSLVAAADLGDGITAGGDLEDMSGVARAFQARTRAFPNYEPGRAPRGIRHKLPVATIRRNHEETADGLYQGNPDFEDDFQVLVAAAKESRLPGGSLVAAGGWCAPSETLYGLCAAETLDGIIDIPEVGITRGGINYTEGPDFADIFTAAGFSQTEAEAIAGETKDCVEVTCPDFDEVRLDAVGICVLAPLLTRAGYPELIERIVNGTVIANQHKVGARVVTQMSTLLGASPTFTLTGTPTTWALLTALELMAEIDRQKYRLGDNETMEVVLPHWAPLAVRADLANRNSVDMRSVSRAQVMEHFADRNLAPQFVYGLQDLAVDAVAFPATVTGLMYPAGTFVKGTADVINLEALYDTDHLQTNTYTAAFAEDGVLVAKMCPGGRKVTVPNLPSGRLGAADLNDPWGTAQA